MILRLAVSFVVDMRYGSFGECMVSFAGRLVAGPRILAVTEFVHENVLSGRQVKGSCGSKGHTEMSTDCKSKLVRF